YMKKNKQTVSINFELDIVTNNLLTESARTHGRSKRKEAHLILKAFHLLPKAQRTQLLRDCELS
ncbi:TraY domain-containing protein, partial [Vibrio splendidus]